LNRHQGFQALPSITLRLILGLTLGTTLLWGCATAYSTYVSYRELNEAFDRSLVETARRLLPLAIDNVQEHVGDELSQLNELGTGRKEYLSFQLRDSTGHIVLRANDAPSEPFADARSVGFQTVGKYRLVSETDPTSGYTITVAETTQGRWEAVTGSLVAMIWPLAVLIPLTTLLIIGTVRAALKPVLRLSEDIAARDGRNLSPLDISGQPRELQPIAQAVAVLVDRLRLALDAERDFAANSAHELRTPIAGALAQTQRMIIELNDPKDRRRAREVEATLKRLASLAERLLQLARVDAGVGLGERAIDLVPALDLLVGDMAKRMDDPTLLRYVKPAGVTLVAKMDLDAFAMAVRNLLDNAVNHGAPEGLVEVVIEPPRTLRICSEGPVVPPDVLIGLTHRFARGHTRHSGSGLGLSIVDTLMVQTGGTLELLSPVPGRDSGFEARITLGDGRDNTKP
jgi:two-component system, OmpR family, sensor kinase